MEHNLGISDFDLTYKVQFIGKCNIDPACGILSL